MKTTVFIACLAAVICLQSCGKKKNIPDVSAIKIQLDTLRFDKDFFAIDTNHAEASLYALQQKYPAFLNDFLYNLLGLPPAKDSLIAGLKSFIHVYKPIYDTVQLKYPSIKQPAEELKHALQFVKYYFPAYKTPKALVTFTGPMEAYSNVLTTSGIAVGLQLYLGKNFPPYYSDYVADLYPEYRVRRFEQDYIAVDCMKNIVLDIYPTDASNQPLIFQMIEAGKRLYALDAFMPETADSLKTGYTQEQLDACYSDEARIWNFFLENNLLYITDQSQIKDYMNDGPRTITMGEKSPGFIGQFVGWQIVKKWMAQDAKRTLPLLLQTPAKQIFEEAKYKPK